MLGEDSLSGVGELECSFDKVLEPAEIVLQEDLESLRRTYSEEERVEFWNLVRSGYKRFMLRCSTRMPRDMARLVRARYRLAQLLLAASFKLNGEGQDSIVSMFRPEEYQLLLDFEEFKIFDHIDVDTIVEFIKRREGKVYELVKKYYEKQYNTLEQRWGPLIGDLVKAIEDRYRARRRKIEAAVIEYVKRYGLVETVSEIEEAVKKVLEAGEFRRRIEEELRRKILEEYRVEELREKLALLEEERGKLLEALERVEDAASQRSMELRALVAELEEARREKNRLMNMYNEVSSRLAMVEKELREAREKLREKEEELQRAMERYRGSKGAVEALSAEAETLRNTVAKLSAELEEYRRMLEAVNSHKTVLEERLREVEAALRGEVEGRLVTAEEAVALAESYLRRVAYKASPPRGSVTIYDPRREGAVRISGWDEVSLGSRSEKGSPGTRSLVLVRKKGVLFRKRDIVVEVVVKLHEDAYASKGYDTKPVTLAEVVEIVEDRASEADAGGYYLVLAIASPTGFTEKAIEYVANSESYRAFASRNTTLYLVDPVTGKTYMNMAMEASRRNSYLVEPELPEEALKRVIDYVLSEDAITHAMSMGPSSAMLLSHEVAKATGVKDPATIRIAFERLQENGWGKVIYVEEKDLVAFQYSEKALREI